MEQDKNTKTPLFTEEEWRSRWNKMWETYEMGAPPGLSEAMRAMRAQREAERKQAEAEPQDMTPPTEPTTSTERDK